MIKNMKIRFNLDKENDRKAYDYLQGAEKSYSKAVISAICEFMELSERTATEDAFRERIITTIYLRKKRAEGKHYNVAVSHAAKKLVRLLYHLETTGEKYIPQTLS